MQERNTDRQTLKIGYGTFAAPYRTGRTSIATAPHSIRLTQILSDKTF